MKSFRKLAFAGLVLILVVGGVGASEYFTVSNTLSREVTVVQDNERDPLSISIVPSKDFGGENGEIVSGERENFRVKIKNDSPPESEPWENIYLRGKFYGANHRFISAGFMDEGDWKDVDLRDVRALGRTVPGAVVDIGDGSGFSIEPGSSKDLDLRIRVDRPVENFRMELRAIRRGNVKNSLGTTKGLESRFVSDLIQDTYVSQSDPYESYIGEDHLEISTGKGSNGYGILKFDLSELPDNVKRASLNLYQYWGSGYIDLKESNVSIRAYLLRSNYSGFENLTFGSFSDYDLDDFSSKENIKGNGEWYSFDLTRALNRMDDENSCTVLLKFSSEGFDNQVRRIRFFSKEGDYPPYLRIVEESR